MGGAVLLGDIPDSIGGTEDWSITPNTPFAGVMAVGSCCYYQTHPSFHNASADYPHNKWFVDGHPFQGSRDFGRELTAVGRYVWKYGGINEVLAEAYTGRIIDLFGVQNRRPLLEKSGPFTLRDSASDHYKFCVVQRAGDCWPSSTPGEIYVNLPRAPTTKGCCGGAENMCTGPSADDVCIVPSAQSSNAIVQRGLSVDPTNLIRPADLQHGEGPIYGARRVRELVTIVSPLRAVSGYLNAKSLPNGLFTLVFLNWDDTPWTTSGEIMHHCFAVKNPLPPVNSEAADYSDYQQVALSVASAPVGTDNVVVKWG